MSETYDHLQVTWVVDVVPLLSLSIIAMSESTKVVVQYVGHG
jgi:hypothetical protein